MTRLQALLIAVSVAFAVVSGTYAAMQTTQLGTGATTHVSATYVADQRRKLAQTAAALHKALRQQPPKLPAVPKVAAPAPRYVYVPAPAPTSRPAAASAAPVLTAAPVVTTAPAARPATHSSSSPAPSGGGEHESDGGGADD